MDTSLISLSQSAWSSILKRVKNSVVFIDPKAGECLHWSMGMETFLLAGAAAIKELNSYKYSQNPVKDARKAVFITTLSYSSIEVDLCDIICESSFVAVTLVTLPVLDTSVIPRLKHDLTQWMSTGREYAKDVQVDVLCFPFFFAPLLDTVVMLPPFRDIFPPMDIHKVKSFGSKPDMIPLKDQATAESLAVYLDSMLSQLSAADVIFSIGTLSGFVASALEDLPSTHHRRKMAQHRTSIVIVDRTLDLCSAASVGSACFLDKLLCALPHLPEHSNDVAVNMSQLAQATVDSTNDESLFPGCLSHQDSICKNAIEWLIHKKDRDILTNLHQILRSELSPGCNFNTTVKPEALEKDVRHFRGNIDKIQKNCGILQIALAVVQTLIGEHTEELEVILSIEKVLCQNVIASAGLNEISGLLPQITKLLNERHIKGLSVDALLILIVLLYSLIGTDTNFPLKEEVQLQAAISTAIFEDQEYPGVVHDILLPLQATKEKVDSVAAHIFVILKALSHARRDLSKYRSVLKVQGQSIPGEYSPVLEQLMRDITDPSKPIMPDLVCKSTGLKDLLKSSFSLLLNKQQVATTIHPSDQPNLFLLILGGVTGGEIHHMHEAWAHSAQCRAGGTLLIASTRLLSPSDTLQAVLKSNPLPS